MSLTQTIYFTLIGITVFDFLFEKWLDLLNDRRKSPTMPPEAEGIYSEERYAKWLAYDKANGRLDIVSSSVSILLSLSLLIFGWFGAIDVWLRQWIEQPVLLGLVYFGVLGVASSVISLPFSIYGTFVIEERFGFNKTTVKTFILDMVKGAALGLVIGAPLGALVIWLYYSLGDLFWMAAWAVLSVFSIFMTMFAATWIMPIFNKFTPLEEGELRTAIEAYCNKVGFKLNRLFVMDGSKRSAKSNAFFSGLGPKKTIAVFGEVHPRVLKAMDVKGPAVAFTIYPAEVPVPKNAGSSRGALAISDLQAVERDLAFVLDAGVAASDVVNAAQGADKAAIDSVRVFDEFVGGSLGEGKKSLAITLRIQPQERTLTEEDIEGIVRRVVEKVGRATGGTLRG